VRAVHLQHDDRHDHGIVSIEEASGDHLARVLETGRDSER
jgi:hypothetical protein